MSRQSLLNYLNCKSNTYEDIPSLALTGPSVGDFQAIGSPITERPSFSTGYDVFGVHWTRAFPTSHYTQGQKPIISDIAKWREEVRFPIIARFDWESVAEAAKCLDHENKVIICTLGLGPFERSTSLSSFEDCLVNAVSEPEDYADLIGAIADYKIEIIRHMHQYAQPDIVNLHDDWGTGLATFFRPELWRETIKPHTKRIYDAIRECGMLVGQHSCGKIESLVGDMVEIGCNVWEAQSNVNDIDALRAQYGGRLCIIAPPPATGFEIGASDEEEPDPETLPLSWRPYKEVPEFLYA